MAQELVTLDQLKAHLRLPLSVETEDEDLQLKLDAATSLVLDYVRQRCGPTEDRDDWYDTVDAWDDETAPTHARVGVLKLAGLLYRFRGDDEKSPIGPNGDLPVEVTMFLNRLRDPAMA